MKQSIAKEPMKMNIQVRAPQWAGAAGFLASMALAVLAGSSYAEDMYRIPFSPPPEGGVPAQSIASLTNVTSTNITIQGYGMQGWYDVQVSSNMVDWVFAGHKYATDFSWSLTVTNPLNSASTFARLVQNNGFVGSGGCAGCHGDKQAEWVGTLHSTALSALKNIGMGNNPSCVVCHTIGFGQPGGFVNESTTPQLANVGCENCHGPAAWHKNSDHDLIHPAVSIDPTICGSCHTDSHHPTFDEYEESLHAQVNDDIKYGVANGLYIPGGTLVTPTNTWYGYYITTNANGTLKTNATTGIIHSFFGPANNPLYDYGQDRAAQCGVCHSAATRMAMLKDYEARQSGKVAPLGMPSAIDSASWSATCATCHDPHSAENTAQLRHPTWSSNYYTMPTTTDKRTNVIDVAGVGLTTNVVFMGTTFASLYDPNVQVCGQCHNSRGARWDGRSYGLITNTVISGPVTNVVYVDLYTNIYTTNVYGDITYILTNTYVIGRTTTNVVTTPTNQVVSVGLSSSISFSRGPHHSPQYNMLIGILQPDYFSTNSSGVATNIAHRHGTSVSSSGVYNTNQCATCHVPNYAVNSETNVTGHTFELSTVNCTISGCHGSVPNFEEEQKTTTNSLSRLVSLLSQWAWANGTNLFGSTNANKYKQNGWEYTTIGALAAATNSGPSSSDQLLIPNPIKQARFNAYMVLNDGSLGVHNPTYASALITDAENKVLSQFTLANFKAFTSVGFAPLSVGFTNLGTGVTGYSWNFGDGNTSAAANPTNVYSNPGLYTVALTATGAGGSETLVRTNYIGVYTRPTVSFTGSPTTGTAPLTVNFTNTSTTTNDVTAWRWTINNARITTPNAVYTFTNAGSYNISLRASTPAGNITTTSNAFITVTP
jgi:PKD repeat protein